MNIRLFLVPENISEKEFLPYIKTIYGISGFKITKRNLSDIVSAIRSLEDFQDRWAFYTEILSSIELMAQIRMRGQPDFFLFGDKHISFCEFKSCNDKISLEQLFWFEQNKGLPQSIAMAFNYKDYFKDKQNADELNSEKQVKV